MVKVALVRCNNYNYDDVLNAVRKGINLIGGVKSFATPEESILLKPNLLSPAAPEKAALTHFSVVKAVGQIFKETNKNVSYGDSPGIHKPITSSTKSGLSEAMTTLGIPLADFENGKEVIFEEGVQNKKFTIANAVLDFDALISISKLKTHGLSRITGAVKNQFGCVPGKLKGEFHVRIPNSFDFCRMLVDLNRFLKPRLFIMDGILAMEGNGPYSGTAKQMNVLLFSSDPIALDATVCRIIDLNPEYVPTITLGKQYGLGTFDQNEIEIVGDCLDSFVVKDFDVVRKPVESKNRKNLLAKILKKSILQKPVIMPEKCIKCGVCVEACPVNPKVLSFCDGKKNPPQYEYNRCIRCYCCQELCPEGAIEIKSPFIRKLFGG